jgi:hypothetical protein
MRRLRPIHRRARDRQREEMPPPVPAEDEDALNETIDESAFVPFVPVSSREVQDEEDAYSSLPHQRRARIRRPYFHRPHLARPSLGLEMNPGLFLIVLLLIASGIFGTLLNLDRVQSQVRSWWPVVLVIGAVLWMFAALLRRRIASFLGGAACAGVGISLLLDSQDIAPLDKTLMGVVLITTGLGIVIRGFLLRQRTSI